jgi:uncharacterized protein (TIGR02453 family)
MQVPLPQEATMAFTGWPTEAIDFFIGLEADNSKAYWTTNRERYEKAVRRPMEELAEAVEDEFGRLHLFRPYRDVRFSRDRSPYKTAAGAVTEGEGGEAYYVQVSSAGLMAASGHYQMATDQLERFRAAVDDDRTGPAVEAIAAALEADGYSIGAMGELKTAPRGYRRVHPRVALLRRKGLMASRSYEPAPWLATPAALDRVVGTWRACGELNRWLATHVGPSQVPPDERRW